MSDWQDQLDEETVARFWEKIYVDPTTDCYVWTGALDKYGYGAVKIAGGARKAHRVCYVIVHGRLADDMTLDHLCREHRCVNPSHMELVTLQENGRRGRLDQFLDGLEEKPKKTR